MDIAAILSHVSAAANTILGMFTLIAIGDDALDVLLYVRKSPTNKVTAQAILAVILQDVGTRAFLSVFTVGLIAGVASGGDPLHAGLAAAAVAAGVSTVALKSDFQTKLAKAFPDFAGSLLRMPSA